MPRICFMGTSEFAVPALLGLLQLPYDLVAVYTQPPRPAGRGQGIQLSPVHHLANQHQLAVFHPENFKSPESRQQFVDLKIDLAIVAAYGLILPRAILTAVTSDFINIHGSLLPRWRGASPIQAALLAGDPETGITIMRVVPKLDAGDILLQQSLPIQSTDTAQSLHDRLSLLGAEMMTTSIHQLLYQQLSAVPQDEKRVTYAGKLTKEQGRLDWQKPAAVLEREIRAFFPWPGSWFDWRGERVRVLRAELGTFTSANPGTITHHPLEIACGDAQSLRLLELQRPSRKALPAVDFIRGFDLPVGQVVADAPL